MESQGVYRTPPQVGKILGVTADKILAWIADGELKGVNVSNGSKRPRWRVSPAELEAFLAKRASTPPAPTPTRRRGRRETIPRFV